MLCPCPSTAWIQLACAFRYGRDDLDVIGLSFRKDIWFQQVQLYPPADHKPAKTAMHEALMAKAGDQGIPFTFNVMSYYVIPVTMFFIQMHTLIPPHNLCLCNPSPFRSQQTCPVPSHSSQEKRIRGR